MGKENEMRQLPLSIKPGAKGLWPNPNGTIWRHTSVGCGFHQGNILYRFQSLQQTTTSQRSRRKEYVGRRWADWVGGVEKFFKEKKRQFSKTSTSERAMVIGLGGLNLFGVIILGTMLKDMSIAPSDFIKFVADIFPLLKIYAGSFFAIPLVWWFFIRQRNAKIEKRNKAR